MHTNSKKKTLFELMKKIIYLTSLLLTSFCFSQQKGNVIINWSSTSELNIGETKINVPQFQSENYQLDSYTKELFFSKKLASTSFGDEKSLEIFNLETEIIPENILGDLDRTKIPSITDAKIINNYARNDIIVSIQITPIIKEGDLYKRVKSFSYSFNSKAEVANRNVNNITNSVLAEGEWFRFYIEKSGVYKISRSFLRDLGITIDNVNPQKIKLYGNGGRMVPLKNNIAYPDDLAENAIQIIGEEDGVFNESDYILFYGEGVDNWSQENLTNGNLYTDKSFYYITYSGVDGKRIAEALQPSASATQIITEFDDTQFHEIDKVNIIKLGRTWFGEEFNTTNVQEFPFTIPNIVTGSNIKIEIHLAATSPATSTFKIEANGQLLGNSTFNAVNSGKYPDENLVVYPSFTATENISLKLTFNNNGVPTANGFLDYINLSYKKQLKGYNKQFRFQNNATSNTNIKEYQISNPNGINQVWDITDINNATKYSTTSQSVFSFKSDFASLRKYIAVDNADFLTPLKDSQTKIANQNIKGNIFKNNEGLFQDIDYLIFTPKNFIMQAEKLANFHRNYSQLNTKVITVESIYPEFSSGKQDIGAIRNLVKYVYNNASIPDQKVKYINLFGDASYDFKKRISKYSNIVPIYHANKQLYN